MNFEVYRGDIFMCEFKAIGSHEQDGTRPFVIVSNGAANIHSPVVTAVPLTTAVKRKPLPTHVSINPEGKIKKSTVLCEQIQSISKDRLGEFLGSLTPEQMEAVDKALSIQIGICNPVKHSHDPLKPCPHCGGRASVQSDYIGQGEMFVYVSCDSCGARTKQKVADNQNIDMILEELKEIWNKRC